MVWFNFLLKIFFYRILNQSKSLHEQKTTNFKARSKIESFIYWKCDKFKSAYLLLRKTSDPKIFCVIVAEGRSFSCQSSMLGRHFHFLHFFLFCKVFLMIQKWKNERANYFICINNLK